MLRQRSRPYLFSNSVSGYLRGFIAVFDMLTESTELRTVTVMSNAEYFRGNEEAGFDINLLNRLSLH